LRYFLELSYKGTYYHGWQSQKNAVAIQEVIEKVLSNILSKEIAIVGSSRTDTGVHAEQQFAHFDFEKNLNARDFTFKLNNVLPRDVAVNNLYQVPSTAHARFDAISRTYQYRIVQQKNPFKEKLAYYYKVNLDLDKMNQACQIILINDNFECFSRVKTEVKNFVCDIQHCVWGIFDGMLTFEIQSNRFLRGMVRALVGTILDVGRGKKELTELQNIIDSRDRRQAGRAAPAHGLFLTKVEYPSGYFYD